MCHARKICRGLERGLKKVWVEICGGPLVTEKHVAERKPHPLPSSCVSKFYQLLSLPALSLGVFVFVKSLPPESLIPHSALHACVLQERTSRCPALPPVPLVSGVAIPMLRALRRLLCASPSRLALTPMLRAFPSLWRVRPAATRTPLAARAARSAAPAHTLPLRTARPVLPVQPAGSRVPVAPRRARSAVPALMRPLLAARSVHPAPQAQLRLLPAPRIPVRVLSALPEAITPTTRRRRVAAVPPVTTALPLVTLARRQTRLHCWLCEFFDWR